MDILGKVISIKSSGQFPSKGHEPVTLLCSEKKGTERKCKANLLSTF